MSSQGNDPRLPSAAKPYKPQPLSTQDLLMDYSGFIAVVFGVFGAMFRVCTCTITTLDLIQFLKLVICTSSSVERNNIGSCIFWPRYIVCFGELCNMMICFFFLQYKICSWLAIIFSAQSLANMKNIETDLRQISMAMM